MADFRHSHGYKKAVQVEAARLITSVQYLYNKVQPIIYRNWIIYK